MSPSTKIFGLLGFPVRHSLSPLMHNAALRALKINARYKLFEKKSDEVEAFLSDLPKGNIRGLNVTIPYKEKVSKFLGKNKSKEAGLIGAVNTIVVDRKGTLKGYNTDYLGFRKHIRELKLKPKRVAMIGAGGAAKAVCFALIKIGVDEIVIYDIDRFKSLALIRRFKDLFTGSSFLAVGSVHELHIKNKDLLINTSPVGMKENDPVLVDASWLHKDLFVYDLIYNPQETRLLKLAKERGLDYANGLGMLLYQGAESFNCWLKPRKAPVEVMRRALMKGVHR